MSNSINKVVISGNLTHDAELRVTAGGTAVLGFRVASNEERKSQQTGEWVEYPNYVDCTMFGRRAEGIQPHLKRGTKVVVQGRLRWSQWESEDRKHSKLEVIVEEIEFLSPAKPKEPDGTDNEPAPASAGPSYGSMLYTEDISF